MALSPPRDAVIIWLSLIFSSSLLFLNLARVGEEEVGMSGRGQSPHCRLTHRPRVRKEGTLPVTSAIPNIPGPVKIGSHTLPPPSLPISPGL